MIEARLYVILARAAPVAAIFRRGPSRRVRLIKWHTDTDELEPGQWFHGRIYAKRADLSPDGSLLVYFAAKHKPNMYSWTAVSRPPYLTALTMWDKGDCWWGGGLFENDRTLWLNYLPQEVPARPLHPLPPTLRLKANPGASGEDYPIETKRWRRDGWTCFQEARLRHLGIFKGYVTDADEIWHRRQPGTDLTLECRIRWEHYEQTREYRVIDPSGNILIAPGCTTWADWDQRGRLVFARGGKLIGVHVRAGEPIVEDEIADLNAMTPEPIETPDWAKAW